MRRALLPLLAGLAALGATVSDLRAQEAAAPHLVTFGPMARVNEGDHDFRQVIRLAVPAGAGPIHLRVFDPDTGGAFDEQKGGYDSRIRFSLFGADARASIQRDEAGAPQETVTGVPLDAVEFGQDDTVDGRWTTLFAIDPTSGGETSEGLRSFLLVVESVTGNDGNVFDVALSMEAGANSPVEGARLFTYLPTLQVPPLPHRAELSFAIPPGAQALTVENFDAAGGRVDYAGPFRTQPLAASGKNEWRRSEIALDADEAGSTGSVTVADGGEIPNDLTVLVTADSGDGTGTLPLAVDLPIRAVPPNRRPTLSLAVEPLACRQLRFTATGSADPDGDTVSYRWRLGGDDAWTEGETVVRDFAEDGVMEGRLEGLDASGQVGGGTARTFSFFVKPQPAAVLEAPALAAQGAAVEFDGSASTSSALPEGNRLASLRWDFGDGTILTQAPGDVDFGRPTHRYQRFGTFTVTLTVTDASDDPCNTAVASRSIAVNAPPLANAGGDRTLATGEVHRFDAALSRDPDGTIVSWIWDFGDGTRASGPLVPHAFHRPGIYDVRLTVLDDTAFDTARGVDTVRVTVEDAANQRPLADAGGDRTARAGEAVRFDAGGSRDADGQILFYAWDFGDGTGGDLPAMEHTYWEPGDYVATLTVRDDGPEGGERAVDSARISVLPAENRPPVAAFPRSFSAETWRPLTLDASRASDRDGTIIAHRWDFGDGASGVGPVVQHVYRAPGFYDARLELVDNGLPDPAVVGFDFQVIVANRPNLAPVAAIGADLAALAGEEVAFDGSASSDPDGSILTHEWDFGDGNRASGVRTRHVYQFPGTYAVTLTVTDDGPHGMLTATDTLTVTVSPAPNQPPVAVAGADMTAGVGEIVGFDGRASSDPDGNVLAWRWSFGDGGVSPDAAPRHAFHDPGVYTVELLVTDDGDPAASARDTVTVTVTTLEARDGGGR